jgi:predicted transcriptional regulator
MRENSTNQKITFDSLPEMVNLMNSNIEKVQKSIEEMKVAYEPKKEDEILTRQDLADMLKVDLSTIHNWVKKGLIIPYYIGNRVFFKKNEIFESNISKAQTYLKY